jgi:hypothetical protein
MMNNSCKLYEESGDPRYVRMIGFACVDAKTGILAKDSTGKPGICHTRRRARLRLQEGEKIVAVDVLICVRGSNPSL